MKLLLKHKQDAFLKRLQKQEPAAQKLFYEQNVKKLLSVSKTYITDVYQAEDCVIKGFCKVFKNIQSFRGDGNLEAWARKIIINECLNFIKSNKTVFYIDEVNPAFLEDINDEIVEFNFNAQVLLDQLPDAYRMVFNLYVLENCSHQEIVEILNISISTSKTQLFRAKEKLRKIYHLQQKKLTNEKF